MTKPLSNVVSSDNYEYNEYNIEVIYGTKEKI